MILNVFAEKQNYPKLDGEYDRGDVRTIDHYVFLYAAIVARLCVDSITK